MAIKNFRYLDNLIHNSKNEIVLDVDIVLDDGEESAYLEGIKLDVDNIIINGNHHTIDGKKAARIFIVTGKNIILKNITLINGFAEEGGAILNEKGELAIYNSAITKNISGIGGAILNSSKLSIYQSLLDENTSDLGGAIYNEGELAISESTFKDIVKYDTEVIGKHKIMKKK